MKENIKILYIHGFHIFGENKKKKLIERAVGKKNMMVANINQKRSITAFICFLLFIICAMLFNIYVSYKLSSLLILIIAIVLSIIIIIIIYFIGSHLILYYIMKKSIKQAEQKIQIYDPDVVVGMYFGAVVAMNLNYKNGKKPLVLISPSIKTFQKFTHNLGADLSTFPYVIIVNGSKDTTTTMGTCDELVSTIPIGKGRLEIVDDDHSYSKLKESDFKSWIKEAKYKPSTCLVNVTKKLKDEQLGQRIKIKTNSFSEITPFENENENEDVNENDPLV
ncbi:hypothetical protein YYC_04025 [Plasmodium yoelii 17X]|nr:conserved protein, unknown function [Plasmodium yoelii]ETB58420.1 hypothetical protein YYC_04025 [Plasmodium yoelii 17X]CDU17042.1 conserved Plasmodium protein, unknown function [Plasmodium yoelii]VTZ75458.1 conserved protein, unknown function [Plasmodium yoelii]|eukprot:XP_022813189.1 conserved protein, unknown function [Plasmodium yoelii]